MLEFEEPTNNKTKQQQKQKKFLPKVGKIETFLPKGGDYGKV